MRRPTSYPKVSHEAPNIIPKGQPRGAQHHTQRSVMRHPTSYPKVSHETPNIIPKGHRRCCRGRVFTAKLFPNRVTCRRIGDAAAAEYLPVRGGGEGGGGGWTAGGGGRKAVEWPAGAPSRSCKVRVGQVLVAQQDEQRQALQESGGTLIDCRVLF